MVFPIFVPSKGRAETSALLPLLKAAEADLQFYFVVEPQDQSAYLRQLRSEQVIVLPQNDQGLAYVRQFVLNYVFCQLPGIDWFWMMDDDISGFFQTDPTERKSKKTGVATVLAGSEQYFDRHPSIAQAGLEYQQYAWSCSKPFTMNGYCDVCVCIHADRCRPLQFRQEVNLKMDRDFTLQVLAAGYDTVRVQRYSFNCPKNGSNAGGLQPVYLQAGIEEANSKKMCEIWGNQICTFKPKKDGRPDVKINWAFFKRS